MTVDVQMSADTAGNTGWLDAVAWDSQGLVPAIAQNPEGRILMVAWMNRDALRLTAERREAHYWSRSRQRLWRKGERSGHVQQVLDIRMDCDNDVLLLTVRQAGGIACHTGRESCFYRQLHGSRWISIDPVLKNPDDIYR